MVDCLICKLRKKKFFTLPRFTKQTIDDLIMTRILPTNHFCTTHVRNDIDPSQKGQGRILENNTYC